MESDDENILEENNVNVNCVQGRDGRENHKARNFNLEFALMFIFFGWNLTSSIIPNQLLKEACLSYGFNATECSQISGNGNATKEIEEQIQPYVAEILMTTSLLTSIIPAVLSLFIGPWTDKFGRKKAICATFFGHTIALGLFWLLAIASEQLPMVNPWLYLIPYIPIIAVGGWPTMIVAVLCYATDLTTEKNRSSRLAFIEMLLFVGVLFGVTSSSYLLKWTDPITVCMISTVCASIASVYTVFYVDESVEVIDTAGTWGQLQELISPAPVVNMIKTCVKRRPFRERRILWCLIMILMFAVFAMNGSDNVQYLFVREKFGWTLRESTLYNSMNLLIAIAGCAIGLVVLKKLFGFSDVTLAMIAILSTVVDSLLKATAASPTQMYVAAFVCLFKILVTPMCRSLMSTIVENNEIGKVYSITSSFEAVSNLVASPLYTYVYAHTFKFFAGAFFLITAGVYCINIILMYCVIRMRRTRELLLNVYAPINS